MKKFLRILFLAFIPLTGMAQLQFTEVDPAAQLITLKNFGAAAIDVSGYRMCSLFTYSTGLGSSPQVTVQSGDFNLGAGEEVTFQWATGAGFGPAETGADLGLYLQSGSFGNPANMVCFMEYGSAGNGREPEAVLAGLWQSGSFVAGQPSYTYTGNGTESGAGFWSSSVMPTVVINELDCDNPSTDNLEFIELFGAPNESLDGLVLVFFNGATDAAYEALDLDGQQCNSQGFFVAGNAAVTNVSLVFSDNTLQNGADAVALYLGNASDFADGTPVTSANLVDALVYDTDDADDVALINALTPGQSQLNESAGGASDQLSLSRVPDGGAPLSTTSYVTQGPTPGTSNVLPCDAGQVSLSGGGDAVTLCLDEGPTTATFSHTTSADNESYLYAVADLSDLILFTSSSETIDFGALPAGTCHVFGFAYNGTLDAASAETGNPVSGLAASLCGSLSVNFVEVTKTECSAIVCDGGAVTANMGQTYFEVCQDETADPISFSYFTTGNAPQYDFVLVSALGAILAFPFGPDYDFNAIAPGTYLIYGINYDGTIDPATVEVGDFLSQLEVDGVCFDVSDAAVTVVVATCGTVDACDDLFFSEYIEGTSNNKAFEIFNPTNAAVNLEDYTVVLYSNGSVTPTTSFVLPGTLGAQESFVVANFDSAPELLALSDETSFVCNFNGDDVLHLVKSDEVIDVFGELGTDPGLAWDIPGGSALNQTLVRKSFITSPVADWSVGQAQWDVFPVDDFSHLGAHTFEACSTTVPQLSFSTSAQGATEGDVVTVTITVSNPVIDAEVTIAVSGGTATEGLDYTSSLPLTLNFPEGSTSSQSFTVQILDDVLEEDVPESIQLVMSGNEDELDFIIQAHTISIAPSDQTYPLHTIAEVTTLDALGIVDSLNVSCELQGIVHGINFNSAGLDFSLIDGDAGINVFLTTGTLGYTVTEGHELSVQGTVAQFEGLATFIPVEITVLSAGNPLQEPETITALNESHESGMVRFTCVELVDPAQWTNAGMDFVVGLTDGVNTFDMLVESECALYGTPAPDGHFTVVGIGHQRDPASPYDSQYMVRPRYLSDLSEFVIASFNAPIEITQDNVFAVTNNSVGASAYFWDFGDGTTSTSQNPSHEYDDSFIEGLSGGTVTVSLVVESASGCTDSTAVEIDVLFVGVDEMTTDGLAVYPNPADVFVRLDFASPPGEVAIYDGAGRQVLRLQPIGNAVTVDVSTWAQGIYLIQSPHMQPVRFVVN